MSNDYKVLNDHPYIEINHNFLDSEHSTYLYNHDWNFDRSSSYDFDTQQNKISQYRTSRTTIDDGTCNFVVSKAVNLYKSRFPFLTTAHFETPQIQMYLQGEQYREHCDFFNYPQTRPVENDRIATLIIYLNDDFLGGTTTFTQLGKTVSPKQGSVLFFQYDYKFEINYLTMHSGDPVVDGCKKIITLWMRNNPWMS